MNQGLAFANGKGGVGKSSLSANVAAVAADSGWQVLVVDLDPQGNLGADLGYLQAGLSDEGAALSRAVQFGEALEPPVRAVHPNLDAIPGGRWTRELARVLGGRGVVEAARSFGKAFDPLVDRYDLIVFDCPPGDDVLGGLGLGMARGLVIPVRCDGGSMDGLEVMAARVRDIRSFGVNPLLELLGIVLFDVNVSATALRAQVISEIRADFSHGVRVFDTAIRSSQRGAFDMRRDGVTAIEYQVAALRERTERLGLLSRGSDLLKGAAPAKSKAAHGLAEDYVALTNEILEAFTAAELVASATEDVSSLAFTHVIETAGGSTVW